MMYEMRIGYGNYHYGCGGDNCNLTVVVLARMLLVLALFGSVYTGNDPHHICFADSRHNRNHINGGHCEASGTSRRLGQAHNDAGMSFELRLACCDLRIVGFLNYLMVIRNEGFF